MKGLRKRIQNGETVLGCWLNLGSFVTAEIVAAAGFDWVLIDLEHGAGTEADVIHQLQAIANTPAAAIVRVESYQRQRHHRVLDFGAEGIMCPRIYTAAEGRLAARAVRYQPEGDRGIAKMVRATGFGRNFDKYFKSSSDSIVGILQIESEEALGCLDDLAALDGVDVLFTGPTDLSNALGVFRQFDHPKFLKAIEDIARAALNAGKAAGILLQSKAEFETYYNLGYRFIASGSDSGFVVSGSDQMAQFLIQARKTAEG